MNKKIFMVFFAVIFFTGSCSSVPSLPASQTAIPPTGTPNAPTVFPTLELPTETATPQGENLISVEPTLAITSPPPPDFAIPVFPGDGDVVHNFTEAMTGQPGNTIYYPVSAQISEIEIFYMDELIRDGWEWVYTEAGESLGTSMPAPALMMEFKKGDRKLGIAAHGFGGGLIVFAGMNISGAELTANFIGAIAGGLDLMGPSESDIKPGAMHFSSALLEFSHPSDWLATDQLILIFQTDNAINYYPNMGHCSVDMNICFVTFSVLKGFHFDHPVSIRVHPELAGMTLEEADELRWNEINSNASALEQRYHYPEDLAQAGSLEIIQIHDIVLEDGTPAIQRVYRWKQDDVEEFIIGTYTLFVSGDILMEFHTDFTSEDWDEIDDTVEQVIASMKIYQ